jgi:hypothetical protein
MFLFSVAFISCSIESDIFKEMKGDPAFNLIYEGVSIQSINDSVKIRSNEIGNKTIDFNINLIDKSRLMDLEVQRISGSGEINIDDKTVDQKVTVSNGTIKCHYTPSEAGKHVIDLTLKDQYGKAQKRRLSLYVFNNLPPVAVCKINKIGQNSDYEIEISAIDSYDTDAKWGGHVVKYQYKIGNYYTYQTDRFASIKHICPGPGKYIISLQVIDEDGGISPITFSEVTL